jgi:hypothetical protein
MMQITCFANNTGQITKNSWLAAGIGSAIGGLWAAGKGAFRGGLATSLTGGVIGALEGAPAGGLGNWILNFITTDQQRQDCSREATIRRYCQDNFPDARTMIWGYEGAPPSQCYQ